ncbi:MAG: hypothetical protein K0R17_1011 [Rariglobus sp.]|nr:hypothetical protein [Rariglobus sp.]
MSLHIVLGFSGPYRESTPDLLYMGLDGVVAEKTRKASPHPRFLVLRDPIGHRRENPTPGVVDIDTLRALQSSEEKEITTQAESDLQTAYTTGGNAAAKHYTEQVAALEARIKELTDALALSEKGRQELTDALAAAESQIAVPPVVVTPAPVLTPEPAPLALTSDAPAPAAPPAAAPAADAKPPKAAKPK